MIGESEGITTATIGEETIGMTGGETTDSLIAAATMTGDATTGIPTVGTAIASTIANRAKTVIANHASLVTRSPLPLPSRLLAKP
jgi:hypothetical protein